MGSRQRSPKTGEKSASMDNKFRKGSFSRWNQVIIRGKTRLDGQKAEKKSGGERNRTPRRKKVEKGRREGGDLRPKVKKKKEMNSQSGDTAATLRQVKVRREFVNRAYRDL